MVVGLLRVLTQDTSPAGLWDEKTRLALGLGFSGWHQSACSVGGSSGSSRRPLKTRSPVSAVSPVSAAGWGWR